MASRATIARAAIAAAVVVMLCGIPARPTPVSVDPYKCLNNDPNMKCCPRHSDQKIVDFKLPLEPAPPRVRRPAHSLEPKAARKYEEAVALMRALPDDHPWSFIGQSNVHCAYCSGGYVHLGLNITLEIHGSWLFYPWHRAYLYFYERILGKLINDTSFAIPFWNWDDPAGMSIPLIYRANTSSLFNPTRFPDGLNFTSLGPCEVDNTPDSLAKQHQCNLQIMHNQFVAAAGSSSLFYGQPLRAAGTGFPGFSPIEVMPHSTIHMSTSADMALITTSGHDPLFFAHHSNVDRIWAIWEAMPANGSKVIDDADFLDASFLFWDDNLQRVRIRVRDVINTQKLGYVYENVPLQWMNIKTVVEKHGRADGIIADDVRFPVLLSYELKVCVAKTKGTRMEKLIVSEIELDGRDYVWFDVYVGRVGGGGGRVQVGSFIHMERRANAKISMVTMLQVGITEFLNDIGGSGDDRIIVTLAPKVGGGKVRIGGVSIV